ncbi:inositol-tetrakisphosphate 1-kinase isoform X2 [Castor canadensis]|uniref:Inositol-tetrakisphosphate 1-kinase isoform X2 n=1 Tax=Castor canadensis TaxID=51338 RepID=A0AC58M1V1_CASCN
MALATSKGQAQSAHTTTPSPCPFSKSNRSARAVLNDIPLPLRVPQTSTQLPGQRGAFKRRWRCCPLAAARVGSGRPAGSRGGRRGSTGLGVCAGVVAGFTTGCAREDTAGEEAAAGSPPEEEDADLSEREESWLLAEREENQEAQFPGLRRAVQLNLNRPIEEQGPLDVIIHKLTDVILEADQNDSQSLELVHRFQEYIDAHPETIVLDPIPAIRTLLDRSKSYELIRKIEAYMKDDRICSPPFMELTSLCGDDTMRLLEQNGLAFPFICKTRVAHGTNSHEMAIVFNQEGLNAIQPPCVVQNFINHNAVLYKVFVVGESYTVVQRPSLKNFSAGTSDRESIFFNSHNVSKPESSSVLTELDKIEGVFERPSDEVIRELSRALRQALGVSLFGIDIIINNQTGQHAIIDVNAFPGYEGVSEFFTDLLNHIATVLQGQSTAAVAAGDVAPLKHSRLLAEQAGSLAGERTCSASPGCCSSMMGQDAPWKVEADTGSMGAGNSAKLPHQRLTCTTGVSPSFQQHCVASMATKASSQ